MGFEVNLFFLALFALTSTEAKEIRLYSTKDMHKDTEDFIHDIALQAVQSAGTSTTKNYQLINRLIRDAVEARFKGSWNVLIGCKTCFENWIYLSEATYFGIDNLDIGVWRSPLLGATDADLIARTGKNQTLLSWKANHLTEGKTKSIIQTIKENLEGHKTKHVRVTKTLSDGNSLVTTLVEQFDKRFGPKGFWGVQVGWNRGCSTYIPREESSVGITLGDMHFVVWKSAQGSNPSQEREMENLQKSIQSAQAMEAYLKNKIQNQTNLETALNTTVVTLMKQNEELKKNAQQCKVTEKSYEEVLEKYRVGLEETKRSEELARKRAFEKQETTKRQQKCEQDMHDSLKKMHTCEQQEKALSEKIEKMLRTEAGIKKRVEELLKSQQQQQQLIAILNEKARSAQQHIQEKNVFQEETEKIRQKFEQMKRIIQDSPERNYSRRDKKDSS